MYRFRVPRAGGGTAPVPPVSPITRSNKNILPNGGIFLLELKLRGLEGRIRKGACDAFSRPGERMERPSGQGGAQPSSEMSGESHYPLQQKYRPEWGDIFVEMMIGEWDSKGTSPRPTRTSSHSRGCLFNLSFGRCSPYSGYSRLSTAYCASSAVNFSPYSDVS